MDRLIDSEDGGPAGGARPTAPQLPRIWTVFLAFVLIGGAGLLIQVIATVILAVGVALESGAPPSPEALLDRLFTPATIILTAAPGQVVFGLGAVVAGLMSPVPLIKRLRLGPPRIPFWGVSLAALGATVPAAVGVVAATALSSIVPPDETLARIYEQMTPAMALPWILFIALAPGVCEEVLFRGYIQTRLDERWPAWLSIGLTSLLFAGLHLMPHTVVFAFPIGLYLGYVTLQTNSIWPAVLGHALVNGSWNTYHVGHLVLGWPEVPPPAISLALVCLAVGSFAATIALLARLKPDVEHDRPVPCPESVFIADPVEGREDS